MKHLLYIILFIVLVASCRRDDLQPASKPRLLPQSVYQLPTEKFDTAKPISFQEFWFDSKSWLTRMHRRFYIGGIVDVHHDFVYDSAGNIATQVAVSQMGHTDSSHYIYRLGVPFFAYSQTENASYKYDNSGRLIERNDTVWSYRIIPYYNEIVPQRWVYNYTDSGVIETRFVQTERRMEEAMKTYIKFHPAVANPFEQLKTRVDHLYAGLLFPSYHYMHFAKQGMLSEMKSILPNGKVNAIWHFDVLKKAPGSSYPQIVKTTIIGYRDFGANDTSIYYHHFSYRKIY